MEESIDDLLILVNEIIEAVGKDNVASEMVNKYNWIEIDPDDINDAIKSYLLDEVFDDEFDATMETLYSEFYNIADNFDYEVSTSY